MEAVDILNIEAFCTPKVGPQVKSLKFTQPGDKKVFMQVLLSSIIITTPEERKAHRSKDDDIKLIRRFNLQPVAKKVRDTETL